MNIVEISEEEVHVLQSLTPLTGNNEKNPKSIKQLKPKMVWMSNATENLHQRFATNLNFLISMKTVNYIVNVKNMVKFIMLKP